MTPCGSIVDVDDSTGGPGDYPAVGTEESALLTGTAADDYCRWSDVSLINPSGNDPSLIDGEFANLSAFTQYS